MSINIYYKDDFKVEFSRKDNLGNTLPLPTYDFTITLFSEFGYPDQKVVATRKNGAMSGATIKGDTLVIAVDNHDLQPGRVMIEREEYMPDKDFPDGKLPIYAQEFNEIISHIEKR